MFKSRLLASISLLSMLVLGMPATAADEQAEYYSNSFRPAINEANTPGSLNDEVPPSSTESERMSAQQEKQNSSLAAQPKQVETSRMGAAEEDQESTLLAALPKKQLAKANTKAGDDDALVSGEKVVFGGGSDKGAGTKAAGFIFGTIFGTPVAMVRAAGADWKRGTSQLSGESKNPVIVGLVGTALLPYAAVSGLVQGPLLGAENAYKREPFSKDAFSLGDEFQ